MLTVSWFIDSELQLALALIWLAYIGFDRLLGYGLKTSAGLGFTHLGRIGKGKAVVGLATVDEAIVAAIRRLGKEDPLIG